MQPPRPWHESQYWRESDKPSSLPRRRRARASPSGEHSSWQKGAQATVLKPPETPLDEGYKLRIGTNERTVDGKREQEMGCLHQPR